MYSLVDPIISIGDDFIGGVVNGINNLLAGVDNLLAGMNMILSSHSFFVLYM